MLLVKDSDDPKKFYALTVGDSSENTDGGQ